MIDIYYLLLFTNKSLVITRGPSRRYSERDIITQGNHPEAKSLAHTVAEKKEDTIIKKDEGKGKHSSYIFIPKMTANKEDNH